GLEDPVEPHGVIHADQRAEEDTAGGGHAGADGEDGGVDKGHGDAHGGGHNPVLGGGADPDAVGGVLEEEPEGGDDPRREGGDGDPVRRVVEVEEREVAGEGLQDLA